MTAETIAAGLDLRRVGHVWRGACPVHGGKSFTLTEKAGKPVFYCWSCGEDGRAAILRELKRRGLWPESNLTPAQKHDFAKERARDKADAGAAGYFGVIAASMAEQALDELSATDPERAVYTETLRALGSEAGLLSEYRAWRERQPEFAAALVSAGRLHRERLELLIANYLYLQKGASHAA